MKQQKSKFERPRRPWDKVRIDEERKIMQSYGFRRKKEIWRAESILRSYRRLARSLAASRDKEKGKILLDKLFSMGMVSKDANIDDVLGLKLENILDRRFQTVIFKKGIAKSIKQARQYIVHGHVAFEGRKILWPSMLVPLGGEEKIALYERSKIRQS
ncbi:30S ribosomal protein S4 [Candidatus Micrarchaeota archaeon RBG_16_36_9]|nr:MAG: 30S ribosomal protein S4 [Candidatus Micrarchaeota archaeon RBG_16_36_9]